MPRMLSGCQECSFPAWASWQWALWGARGRHLWVWQSQTALPRRCLPGPCVKGSVVCWAHIFQVLVIFKASDSSCHRVTAFHAKCLYKPRTLYGSWLYGLHEQLYKNAEAWVSLECWVCQSEKCRGVRSTTALWESRQAGLDAWPPASSALPVTTGFSELGSRPTCVQLRSDSCVYWEHSARAENLQFRLCCFWEGTSVLMWLCVIFPVTCVKNLFNSLVREPVRWDGWLKGEWEGAKYI